MPQGSRQQRIVAPTRRFGTHKGEYALKNRKLVALSLFIGILAAAWTQGYAAEDHAAKNHGANHDVVLSPGLLELLRAEMREISGGIGSIPLALAAGDWGAIHDTGVKLRDSYIMKKALTPAQIAELQHALPEEFRRQDAGFHQRAGRLAEAASARDAELVVFHYARLMESCALCHSTFARERFPGFGPPPAEDHHH